MWNRFPTTRAWSALILACTAFPKPSSSIRPALFAISMRGRSRPHCCAIRYCLWLGSSVRSYLFCLLLAAGISGGHARTAAPLAADPALEDRVLDIAGELRCLVCQNETIAASHADLAVDLREQIRHRLAQGQSREQVEIGRAHV